MKGLEDLERLALAATPGPWKHRWTSDQFHGVAFGEYKDSPLWGKRTVAHELHDDNAAYIAAASPDVILSLIRELKITRLALDKADEHTRGLKDGCVYQAQEELYPETEQP